MLEVAKQAVALRHKGEKQCPGETCLVAATNRTYGLYASLAAWRSYGSGALMQQPGASADFLRVREEAAQMRVAMRGRGKRGVAWEGRVGNETWAKVPKQHPPRPAPFQISTHGLML